MNMMYQNLNFHTLGCSVNLYSNNVETFSEKEYFKSNLPQSQLNNFYMLETSTSTDREAKSSFVIDDSEKYDQVEIVYDSEGSLCVRGNFRYLEKSCYDKRFSIFGTAGVFYRYFLSRLELECGISNFHASAVYDESRNLLTVFLGKSGTGKTPQMLLGLSKGHKLFGTDHIFFSIASPHDVIFYKGGVRDNIRISTLQDFPEINNNFHLGSEISPTPDHKVCVDLSDYEFPENKILNPTLKFIFCERKFIAFNNGDELLNDQAKRILFDNASEKISGNFMIYQDIPICNFDSQAAVNSRIKRVKSIFTCNNAYFSDDLDG